MRVATTAAVVLLVTGACGGGTDRTAPSSPTSPAASAPGTAGVTSPIRVATHRAVGYGRGLVAASAGGVTVVVTSAGVLSFDGDTEPRRLTSFAEPVGNVDVALSPDGQSAAVVTGHPASVRFYDLSGAPRERVVPFEEGQISSVGYSADGRAWAQGPQTLVAWPQGPDLAPVALDGGATLAPAAVLPDGRIVAPEPGTDELWVGPLAGPLERVTVSGIGDGTLLDVHASPAGLALSVGRGPDEFSRTDDVVLVDPATWEVTATITAGHRMERTNWALGATAVALAGPGGTAVYDLRGAQRESAIGAAASVYAAPNGFVTVADDGTLSLWSDGDLSEPAATGAAPHQPNAFRVANGTISIVGFDGDVRVWDARTGAEILVEAGRATGELTSLAAAPDGRLAVGSTAGTAIVYDADLRQIGVIDEGRRRIDSVAFDPERGDVVTALAERVGDFAFDDSVARWDRASFEERFRIAGEGQDVAGCAFFYNRARFSPDGSLLAIVRHTFEVSLVNPDTGSVVHTFPPHGSTVFDVAFDDAGHLVTTADDATVRVWRLADYSRAAEYPSTPGGYSSAVPLGRGAMAVTGIAGNVTVVDVLTGAALGELPTSARDARPAASPSGSLLAVPAPDGSVEVWSIETRSLLTTLVGPAAPISELLFVDDSTLVGASRDGTLHEWTLTTA